MVQDNFSFGIEIDLEKSRVDANGDVIIEGLASSGDEDYEGHSIDPTGWDLGYFLRKGFIKYEHAKDPRNFIGEPLEAKSTKAGLYVKGRLYGHMPRTQEVVEMLDGLKKSQSTRKIGLSIEGSALARDPNNPNRITKAVLRNVALTANPVNSTTWVDLVKSLTSKEALEVQLDETEILLKKALSTDSPGGAVLQPQALEQDDDDDDPKKRRQKIIDTFRKFIHTYLQKTTLQKSLNIATREGAAGFAMGQGLDENDADDFASLIDNNRSLLKSLAARIAGGELSMSKVTDDLQKSLELLAGKPKEADELSKSVGTNEDADDFAEVDEDLMDQDADDDLEYEPDDEDADDDLGGDMDGDGDDDDEDSELVKSLRTDDPEIQEAFEVTGFLRTIANRMGRSVDGLSAELQKSLDSQSKVNGQLMKSLGAVGKVMVDLHKRAEDAEKRESETMELVKSLSSKVDQLMNTPVGRRSVVSGRDLIPLQKSLGDDAAPTPLRRDDVVDLLIKGFEKGEVDKMDVSRFETGGLQAVSGRGKTYLQRTLNGASR